MAVVSSVVFAAVLSVPDADLVVAAFAVAADPVVAAFAV